MMSRRLMWCLLFKETVFKDFYLQDKAAQMDFCQSMKPIWCCLYSNIAPLKDLCLYCELSLLTNHICAAEVWRSKWLLQRHTSVVAHLCLLGIVGTGDLFPFKLQEGAGSLSCLASHWWSLIKQLPDYKQDLLSLGFSSLAHWRHFVTQTHDQVRALRVR